MSISAATKLEDLVGQLSQRMTDAWTPTVLPAIRLMHRARNAAQHEGLEPDRDQIPQWATATESFVVSLVEAHFGVDLRAVVLADAIHNPEWSAQLREAESALADGGHGACVQLAREAQGGALAAWGRLHRSDDRPTGSPFDPLRRELAPVNRRVDLLEQTLRSQTFAVDPSEAAWFQDVVRAQPEHVTRAEAERALRYAFDWIVGFELATADWIADRARLAALSARRIRTADTPARIDSVLGVEPDLAGWVAMTVRCADVPPDSGYDVWQSTLRAVLTPEHSYPTPWEVRADGTVIRRCQLDAADIERDIMKLANALPEAERQIAEAHRTRAESESAEADARARRLEELSEHSTGVPKWVTAIDWQPGRPPGDGGGGAWYLQLSNEASALTFPDIDAHGGRTAYVTTVLRQHQLIDNVVVGYSFGIQLTPDLPAEQLSVVLNDVDAAVSSRLNEQHNARQALAARCAEILEQAERAVHRVRDLPAEDI